MKILKDIFLKNYSTLKIGGKARYFCKVNSISDLKNILNFASQKKLKIFILGAGSNVLFPDKNFKFLVIKINLKKKKIFKKDIIITQSGVLLPELIKFTEKNSLSGLEWASGIPGTLGGCVFENCGAFGKEIKNLILWVKTISLKPPFFEKIYFKKNLNFSYRFSLFKELKEVIVEVALKLKKSDKKTIQNRIKKFLEARIKTQPIGDFSCGCVFKNISFKELPKIYQKKFKKLKRNDKISTGFLIDMAGLKGKRIGGIQISKKHANFFINLGKGKSSDFKKLIFLCKKKIKEKFNINLKEEIEIFH
ncbi:UDP-N-acetylmuramate dehydrogenase [bacterium]|nr:UDP-N-acetylmuramate dehydrogenase [bacterium]